MNRVMGIAWNDSTSQILRKENGKVVWRCPYYKRWKKILERCFYARDSKNNPTYKDVEVCEEWLYFSNFKSF